MADFATIDLDDVTSIVPDTNGYHNKGYHSSQSSTRSSEVSASHDVNDEHTYNYNNNNNDNNDPDGGQDEVTSHRRASLMSDASDGSSRSQKGLVLIRGNQLREESRTEPGPDNWGKENGDPQQKETATKIASIPQKSWSGGTAKERAAKSPYGMPSSAADSIPEEEITIPKDANISSFTVNQLANFLKCLKIDERIITHLHRKSVDGKRFSKLSDTELENLNINNPVLEYFRERSSGKPNKKKGPFML